jgi:hypothetical protein
MDQAKFEVRNEEVEQTLKESVPNPLGTPSSAPSN